jgi:glycosyltransferase involved in cell wall biosynthesis
MTAMETSHSKKLKTVFVLPSLTAGGAERALITFMNTIERRSFAPIFITLRDDGPMGKIIDPEIPFHSLNCKSLLLSIPRLYLTLKALRPDIVISTMAQMNLILMLLRPFFPRTRFVIREAITPSFSLKDYPFLAPLLKLAYKILYPRATIVISPAKIILDEFRSVIGLRSNNQRLLYNFVDLDRIRAQADQTISLAPDREKTVHFVAAGRLHPQKGFGRLLLALASMRSSYNWKLTILGEGPRRSLLEALIKKYNLTDNVDLPGLSENPWPHFAAADFFLLPSRWEGLPNVALEALACGTPVIASAEAGGIEEIALHSYPGSVKIARTMDEFVDFMEAAKPSLHTTYRDSLLTEEFQKERVIENFETMLMDAWKSG